MANEEDCCFQCQEPGHITQNCPHIMCYECNEYGHIIMDYPHRVPPSRTPVTHHKTDKGHHARLSLMHHCEDWDRQSQSRLQSHYQSHHSLSHHNSHRGCSRSQHQDRCSHHRSSSWWSCSANRDTVTDLTVTHCTGHIADHPHITALRVINPQISAGDTYDHPTNLQGMNHTDQTHIPARWEESHIPKRTWSWR